MRRLKRNVISFAIALALIISGLCGYSVSAEAAELPVISITPMASNSYNEQAFEVYVSVAGGDYESNYGNGVLNQGYNYLTFATSDTVHLNVYAPYLDDYGDQRWHRAYADSSNAYNVTITCVGTDGKVLQTETRQLSKYNNPEVLYTAPASFDGGNTLYTTASNTLLLKYGQGNATITYTAGTKEAHSYTVNYLDEKDAILETYSKTLNYGETATIEAPETIEKDGKTYQLESKTKAYSVNYDTASGVYTFEYAEVIPAPSTPYEITINLVNADDNDALLYSIRQTLDVDGKIRVELPSTYEVNSKQYQLADGVDNYIEREFSSTRSTIYTIPYVVSGEYAPYNVTVNFVDYSNPSNILSAITATVTADGEPFMYDIGSKQSITVGSTEYRLISGQGNGNGQIIHSYGTATRTYNVYYSARIVEEPGSYDVTIRYICINDNKVLSTVQKKIAYGQSVTFDVAPAEYKSGEATYIRLNGQENAITHDYNDSQRNYAVYYRDASIEVEEEPIVITEVITQYVTRDDGTISENGDGTSVPQNVPVTTVTDGNGNETNYNEEGQPVEVNDGELTTIEDETTPLADGVEESETEPASDDAETEAETLEDETVPLAAANNSGSDSGNVAMTIGILAIIIIIAAAIVTLIIARSKKRA